MDAIERYNGVQLDGKPMKIELIGNKTEPHPTEPLMYNGASSNYNATPNRLVFLIGFLMYGLIIVKEWDILFAHKRTFSYTTPVDVFLIL